MLMIKRSPGRNYSSSAKGQNAEENCQNLNIQTQKMFFRSKIHKKMRLTSTMYVYMTFQGSKCQQTNPIILGLDSFVWSKARLN